MPGILPKMTPGCNCLWIWSNQPCLKLEAWITCVNMSVAPDLFWARWTPVRLGEASKRWCHFVVRHGQEKSKEQELRTKAGATAVGRAGAVGIRD